MKKSLQKKLSTYFAFLLILFTLQVVFAQTKTNPNSYCPQISENLYYGLRDEKTNPKGQVSELQNFFMDYYYWKPKYLIMGTYDATTFRVVKGFQREQGIRQTGTVGSATRQAIVKMCNPNSTQQIIIRKDPASGKTQNILISTSTQAQKTIPNCSEREVLCFNTLTTSTPKDSCTVAKNNCLNSCQNGSTGVFVGPYSGKPYPVSTCK